MRGSFSIAADFLPTFMYCLGSQDFEVVQTALRNLPEYALLCQGEDGAPSGAAGGASPESWLLRVPRSGHRGQGVCGQRDTRGPVSPTEHAAVLLHRAFLVGMYGQMDPSAQISEALRILHMEAVM